MHNHTTFVKVNDGKWPGNFAIGSNMDSKLSSLVDDAGFLFSFSIKMFGRFKFATITTRGFSRCINVHISYSLILQAL